MKKLKVLILAISVLSIGIVTGCTSTKESINMKSKDFGIPPNISSYQAKIERGIKLRLKDPDSAKIEKCIPPRKAYVNKDNREVIGWAALCMTNAKNSFGGYTGRKIWAAFLANDGKGSHILLNIEPSNAKQRTIHVVQ